MTTFSIASLCVISETSTTCISVGVAELLSLPAGTLGPLGLQPFGSGPSCWGHNNSSPGSLSIAVYKGPCSCLDKGSCLGWCHCYSYRSSCIHWMTDQLRYNLVVDSGLAVLQGTKCDYFHGVVLWKTTRDTTSSIAVKEKWINFLKSFDTWSLFWHHYENIKPSHWQSQQ